MGHGAASLSGVSIKIVGVGGAGCNALNHMIAAGLRGVEFIAVDTHKQALLRCRAALSIRIGDRLTGGLGTGGDPILGREAAQEAYEELHDALQGAELVFVVAGMGGGTGSGAAPVVAEAARVLGALTVGVITRPFNFEGDRRRLNAGEGAAALGERVDTLISVPKYLLVHVPAEKTTAAEAFRRDDEALLAGIQAITDPMNVPCLINVGFADIKSVLSSAGPAVLGLGLASGEGRVALAARRAISGWPLTASLEGEGGVPDQVAAAALRAASAMENARGVLFTITGGDYTLLEVDEAAAIIQEAADSATNIIFGALIDESMGDEMRVTVIATGLRYWPHVPRQGPGPAGEPPRPGRPPWSGGPPPSEQRVPRRPPQGQRGGAAEAIPPASDLPAVDAVGTTVIP